MWSSPEHYKRNDLIDLNKEFEKLEDELDDEQAKITLAKFLRQNLGICTYLLSGITLESFQKVILRAFFNRNFSMAVLCRGGSKSYMAAIFCILYCLFNPGARVVIAGPTFRTSRRIFDTITSIIDSKEADLLAQVFQDKNKFRSNDQNKWIINGGYIIAIPLSGEKLRGFRADVIVLDEYLLLPEDVIDNVLMPFLISPRETGQRIKIRKKEDKLIKEGRMKEEDRQEFTNEAKMIALSSASYTFENLYATYQRWIRNIFEGDTETNSKYFVCRLSYEALPEHMIDPTIIEEAHKNAEPSPSFLREYCAQFTDGSEGFFSAKKMKECTIPNGERPTTLIFGDPKKEYILAIDPNHSDSPTADYFAMAVLEIDEENDDVTLVHNYGVAGVNTQIHINYLYYLLKVFNIKLIVIDHSLSVTIKHANNSKLFIDEGIEIKFVNYDGDKEGDDYNKMLNRAREDYDPTSYAFCVDQQFSSNFIRKANAKLQSMLHTKKLWFASQMRQNDDSFNRQINRELPIDLSELYGTNDLKDQKDIKGRAMIDHIETQDNWIHHVQRQMALIEPTITVKGSANFDLPAHLKKEKGPNKARKDNYSALLMAVWGWGIHKDLKVQPKKESFHFDPVMIDPHN